MGEKTRVQTVWINPAPHHRLGQAIKAGKEEIMGLLAAVEYWATNPVAADPPPPRIGKKLIRTCFWMAEK